MRRPSCTACHAGDGCPACGDLLAQARDWVLAKCPPSVSGSGGHTAALLAARTLVGGFALGEGDALRVLAEWNAGCQPPWSERDLAHKVKEASKGAVEKGRLVWRCGNGNGGGTRGGALSAPTAVSASPVFADVGKALEFDMEALHRAIAGRKATWADLRAASSEDVLAVTPERFLHALYEPGEIVLVFSSMMSQGEWAWRHEGEAGQWYRLGATPAEGKVRCARPALSQREGVWYLAAPVTGGWRSREGQAPTRRSEVNVTSWRWMVVESDIQGIEGEWVTFLASLPLPIVAIYTSGGRSAHALVRVDATTKAQWDACRAVLRPLLTKCGADKGVFSAVRLTRLPGFIREGKAGKSGYAKFPKPKRQQLVYFNPAARGAWPAILS